MAQNGMGMRERVRVHPCQARFIHTLEETTMSVEIKSTPKTAGALTPPAYRSVLVRSLLLAGAFATAGFTGLTVATHFQEAEPRVPVVQQFPSANVREGRVMIDPCVPPRSAFDGHPTQRKWVAPATCTKGSSGAYT